jgi:hypothetical protein
VRQALGSEGVQVTEWARSEMGGGFGGTGALWRISGVAADGGDSVDWSFVLKIVRPNPEALDPSTARYWRREPDAYRSGTLDDLPAGLVAPRCHDVVELEDAILLWLDEVEDPAGDEWTVLEYAQVARALGQFNGAYLVERSALPSGRWVSKRWLEAYVSDYEQSVEAVLNAPDHPLVRLALPPDCAARLRALYAQRDRLLNALDALPQTFCHLDIHRRNVFLPGRAGDRPIAIDWAFAGVGAIGEDLASMGIFAPSVVTQPGFDDAVFGAYLSGLADVGWDGDPRLPRLGFAASSSLWQGIATPMATLAAAMDPEICAWLEKGLGRPIEEWFAAAPPVRRYRLGLGEEALRLLDELGL